MKCYVQLVHDPTDDGTVGVVHFTKGDTKEEMLENLRAYAKRNNLRRPYAVGIYADVPTEEQIDHANYILLNKIDAADPATTQAPTAVIIKHNIICIKSISSTEEIRIHKYSSYDFTKC